MRNAVQCVNEETAADYRPSRQLLDVAAVRSALGVPLGGRLLAGVDLVADLARDARLLRNLGASDRLTGDCIDIAHSMLRSHVMSDHTIDSMPLAGSCTQLWRLWSTSLHYLTIWHI